MEPATPAGYLRYIILAYSLKSKEEHLREEGMPTEEHLRDAAAARAPARIASAG